MRNLRKGKELPIWVEILFVQIGLPDSFLRSYLKNKRLVLGFIKERKGRITSFIFIVLTIFYIYPLVKQADIKNNCITNSRELVKKSYDIGNNLSEQEIEALSTSFCNGGNII